MVGQTTPDLESTLDWRMCWTRSDELDSFNRLDVLLAHPGTTWRFRRTAVAVQPKSFLAKTRFPAVGSIADVLVQPSRLHFELFGTASHRSEDAHPET